MTIALADLLQDSRVRVGWTTSRPAAWAFDLDAIRQAARELGVTGEVEVGCAEYANGRWAGMHSVHRGVHRIRVGRTLSAEDASRILWHELTHAAQWDRGERHSTREVLRDEGRDAYMTHPAEIEARANEREHDRLALTA